MLILSLSHTLFFQCFLNFRSKLRESIIIGSRIMVSSLALIAEGNLYERHQGNGVITLAAFVDLGVCTIALRDELGCRAEVLLVFAIVKNGHDVFIIDMQPDI